MGVLQQRVATAAPKTDAERHEIIADIWETHAIDDRIEDEIQLAELDTALIDQMTQMYDDDVDYIGNMAGVKMLLPFS